MRASIDMSLLTQAALTGCILRLLSFSSCRIVFNTFVFMQLFNQLNCRKILDEADVFEGLDHHLLFCGILGAEVVLQVLIVQYGGRAFQTTPLGADHWALCLGLGSLTLGVRAALRTVDAKQLFAGTPLDKALGKP